MTSVTELIAAVLDVDVAKIQLGTVRTDIDEWDSLAQLGLVAALEETYGITLSSAQMKQCDSVPEIVAVLQAHQISA
jgi:acyl carrier protein